MEEKPGIIVFDADRSLAPLGGPQELKELFRIAPVPVDGGLDQLKQLFLKLLKNAPHPETHEAFGDLQIHMGFDFNDAFAELNAKAVVIDSLSHLGWQTRNKMCTILPEKDAKGKPKGNTIFRSMEIQDWGKYGEDMMRLMSFFKSCNFPVILTCHISRDTDEFGGPIDLPGIKGAMKLDTAQFMDVVVYTRIVAAKNGEKVYKWQTVRDSRRNQAKSRVELPDQIPQDFGIILKAFADHGIHNPKILVVGDAGTGKTTSLRTLVQAYLEPEAEPETELLQEAQ